jgi:hypothetical protein
VVSHIPTTISATRDLSPMQPFWRVSLNSGRYETAPIGLRPRNIGARIKHVEDHRLLTGQGMSTDDAVSSLDFGHKS